jgi:hypothetical protein
MAHVVENLLDDFDGFRSYCDGLKYSDTENPADGVFYPGINLEVPPRIITQVIEKIQTAVNAKVKDFTVFLRMTLEAVPIPHQAHTDSTMGDYGLILFLNRPEHCQGGTAFVRHIETGLERNPVDDAEQAVWERDHNNREGWEIREMIDMKPNRGFIFDTQEMHRAEPPSAFGTQAHDGRLVLVCFVRAF